ncbi:hypothetical protein CUROG_05650 [Corynebacterium urogenitale]|uniref:Uncharacterized protein n=1 Tax=Corynebacterium urogenitale TaxID=2487892 RepID=A0A5J6Z9V7_9CORY|nr:hypothetical protein CUROG_05650 [Corynebacterium urogenitale]
MHCTDILLDFVCEAFEGIIRNISSLAGAPDTLDHFFPTELFSHSTSLHHEQNGPFYGCEARATITALSTPSNRYTLFDGSRVDNARLLRSAGGTQHNL